MRYFINPAVIKGTSFEKTDLSNISEHRLSNLIIEGIEKYPNSRIEEIHNRIGEEIPIRRSRQCLYNLVKEQIYGISTFQVEQLGSHKQDACGTITPSRLNSWVATSKMLVVPSLLPG